jgi:indole-3-glycerol phosphate synthase
MADRESRAIGADAILIIMAASMTRSRQIFNDAATRSAWMRWSRFTTKREMARALRLGRETDRREQPLARNVRNRSRRH